MSGHESNRNASSVDNSALSPDTSQASLTNAVLGRDPVVPHNMPSPTTGHGNPSDTSSPELAPRLRQWRRRRRRRRRRQTSPSDYSDDVHEGKAKENGNCPSSGTSDYTTSATEPPGDNGDDESCSEKSKAKSKPSSRSASSHKSQDAPAGADTSDAASEESYRGFGYPSWKPKRASVRDCESDCTEVKFSTMVMDLDECLNESKADGDSWRDTAYACRRDVKTCKARRKWLQGVSEEEQDGPGHSP